MNNRITAFVVAALLVCLGIAVPAQAQAPCTAQTFTGTYALYERGSSAVLDPTSQPYPYHWAGALAPFIAVGQVTLGPDGIGNGFYWIRIGSFNGGLDPIPLEVVITELNPDCTGKWQFEFNLLGTPNTIEERFILFDNGRRVRSIPTVTGIPTMAWVGEGHRVSKAAEPPHMCGSHTANGSYVVIAENLVLMGPNPLFSDAVLIRVDISMDGDFTGMFFEKLGPKGNIEIPVWGTVIVNSDCSFEMTLVLTIQGRLATSDIRGVFFDEGKRFYGLNMHVGPTGTQYSFADGQRIAR